MKLVTAANRRLEVVFMLNLDDLIGAPFVDGGTGPGYDCWHLAMEVWRRLTGQELPDYQIGCYHPDQISAKIKTETATKYEKVSKPSAPALVVFKFNEPIFINHIGVYLGGCQFIHAREKTGVTIERLDHPYWRRVVQGFYIPRWQNEINDNQESV
jgi:cell wall-associated NlpC family hydrolase